MKTQKRAICPCCFNDQAIKGDKMVAHGYTRPYEYAGNVGNCAGVGRAHFGTEVGKAIAIALAFSLRQYAAQSLARAEKILSGEEPLRSRSGAVIENPMAHELSSVASSQKQIARYAEADAKSIDQRVADWVPTEPYEIEVAPTVTLVHFRRANWGKACASSRMGAERGNQTSEKAHVTCAKCLERLG